MLFINCTFNSPQPNLQELTTLSPDERQQVKSAFSEMGAEKLKPVFEKLEEKISYDDLRILRLVNLSREKSLRQQKEWKHNQLS